ncbi:hypothetical protein KC19_1G118800 [Ceratodon purpureus]|uniref:PTM/DIR17-like Tudor domain-containing protein n=1 Tax=Ceratodon purpureus TaxID=3225 RepID=A0A8T0J443_CERPU|nr:hypothetical protein KC19_1G118800 [Ceratodon purpureus]
MGQTWSKFMSGHMEAGSNDPPVPEACSSPDPSGRQSQASTEASSSVPLYQGGPFSVAAADVELSSLKDEESDEERDQERGKETQTTPTPTPSTSQQLSPLQAFLKGPEKVHLKKSSQASPSTACKYGPLKGLDQKSRAFKQPRISSPPATTRLQHQHHASKLDAEPARKFRAQQESSTPSPSQFSPSQVADEEVGLQLARMEDDEDEETASQSMLPETEDDLKVDSTKEGEDFVQPPHSSAQKMLFFELDRKRKAPAGLPSLAVEYMGSSRVKLKARTLLEKSSEGGARKDLGAGESLVGRRVRKAVGSRGISEGHVCSYDVSSRLYQIEYDNGKEEAMEWLDLEPCLIDQSKTSSAPVEEVKGIKPVRKSLRNAATKVKKVEEFVYTKRSIRGRRRKK